jgi:signal peptidase I
VSAPDPDLPDPGSSPAPVEGAGARDAVGVVEEPVGPAGAETPPAAAERGRRSGRWLVETVAIIAVALVVALLLRTFVVQTYYIPSGSMLPTLAVGDRIVVNKLSYHLHGVDRGDIVVFARPPDEHCGGQPVNDLVKRVIGLPGETISSVDGQVYINDKALNEPWLQQGMPTNPVDSGEPFDLTHPYKIPPGTYFVMGDNRTASCDSRYWGPIPRSLIVGKVEMRIWPLSRVRFF